VARTILQKECSDRIVKKMYLDEQCDTGNEMCLKCFFFWFLHIMWCMEL